MLQQHIWHIVDCGRIEPFLRRRVVKYPFSGDFVSSTMIEKMVTVGLVAGLHARPSAALVREASKFDSELTLELYGFEVNGIDLSQSSEIGHSFFVKMTWIGCNVDGGWIRLLGGGEINQVAW